MECKQCKMKDKWKLQQIFISQTDTLEWFCVECMPFTCGDCSYQLYPDKEGNYYCYTPKCAVVMIKSHNSYKQIDSNSFEFNIDGHRIPKLIENGRILRITKKMIQETNITGTLIHFGTHNIEDVIIIKENDYTTIRPKIYDFPCTIGHGKKL